MGTEQLTIPEEKLPEVIAIIQAGLKCWLRRSSCWTDEQMISKETFEQLEKWCEEFKKGHGD